MKFFAVFFLSRPNTISFELVDSARPSANAMRYDEVQRKTIRDPKELAAYSRM